jgi:hypothetical protein
MLIDDRAQSQSENTGLILKAVHGTVFVGSATTGANGEGSNFVVPGGIFVGMTGVGVSHPDGTQLQRIRVSLAHALGRRRRQQRDDHRGGGGNTQNRTARQCPSSWATQESERRTEWPCGHFAAQGPQ